MSNIFNKIRIFSDSGTELSLKKEYAVLAKIEFDKSSIFNLEDIVPDYDGPSLQARFSDIFSIKNEGSWAFMSDIDLSNKALICVDNGILRLRQHDLISRFSSMTLEERISKIESLLLSTVSTVTPSVHISGKTYIPKSVTWSLKNQQCHMSISEEILNTGIGKVYEYHVKDITINEDSRDDSLSRAIDAFISKFKTDLKVDLFPYFYLSSSVFLEKTSAGLVSPKVLYFVEEDDRGICKPYSDKFDLQAYVKSDNHLKIFEIDDSDAAQWIQRKDLGVTDAREDDQIPEPLHLSVGFSNDEEGVFTEDLELYIRDKRTGSLYGLGVISFICEVEGEDERYRAFFTNFGIPDPATYPNLFKEQDPDEQGIDWTLVNDKSKELYLSYDKIFPYVGTYKALINAVVFLGYDDILFKEWYSMKDYEGKSKKIAFDSLDIKNKETLSASLASHGVSVEEFMNYKKLNQISMIYKINQVVDDEDTQVYYESDGEASFDIPLVERTYDYSNESVLQKLISLRDWLQEYIIGVNCRIIEITGEGVYFARFKNQAYSTRYDVTEYQKYGKLTPKFIENSEGNILNDSSVTLNCTLAEFNSLHINDYDDIRFKDYARGILDASAGLMSTSFEKLDDWIPDTENVVPRESLVTTLFEAPVNYDEISFEATTDTDEGTLHEYASAESNEIMIEDNRINLFKNDGREFVISEEWLPRIFMEKGNIRKTWKTWTNTWTNTRPSLSNERQSNLEWIVNEVWDQDKAAYVYELSNVGDKNGTRLQSYDYFCLVPYEENASMRYTDANKWQVPMFIINGYAFLDMKTGKTYQIGSGDYVLEIFDGYLSFNPKEVEDSSGTSHVRANLNFYFSGNAERIQLNREYSSNDWRQLRRYCSPEYIYTTNRERIWHIEKSKLSPFGKISLDIDDVQIPESMLKRYRDALKSMMSNSFILAFQDFSDNDFDELIKRAVKGFYSGNGLEPSDMKIIEDALEQTTYLVDKETLNSMFINNDCAMKQFGDYMHQVVRKQEDSMNWKEWKRFISEIVSVKTEFPMKVNRKGNYSLVGKAYGVSNEIYVNSGSSQASVTAYNPTLDIYASSRDSGNRKNFWTGENVIGTQIAKSSFVGYDPLELPYSSRIIDMDFKPDKIGAFSNLSCSYDVPERGSHLIVNNFTERIASIKILKSGSDNPAMKLEMIDENPRKSELYIPGTHLNVVFYDTAWKQVIKTCGPYKIMESNPENAVLPGCWQIDSSADVQYSNQSYIWIQKDESLPISPDADMTYQDADSISMKSRIQAYAINVEEFKIVSIENDYDANRSTVKVLSEPEGPSYFKPGEKVKVSFYIPFDGSTTMNEKTAYTARITDMIAQTAYEVLSSESSTDNILGNDSSMQAFVLDGLVNSDLIRDGYYKNGMTDHNEYRCTLSRAFQDGVQMNADVLGSLTDNIFRNDAFTIFGYSDSNWFANRYLDHTWSGYLLDYVPDDVLNDWAQAEDWKLPNVWRFSKSPITLKRNEIALFGSTQDKRSRFEEIHRDWSFINKTVNNIENVLYRSVNKIPGFRFSKTESYRIEGKSYDKYGNIYKFGSDGALFVEES